MSPIVTSLTAFVLAGGKSSRMGRDKAFLPWGEGTLLSHALQVASAVSPRVRIVGSATKFVPFGPVVEDIYRDRGPLGGIHAALAGCSTDLNLMLAVDLPFIEPRFLHFMIALAEEGGAVVTVSYADGVSQPLCAVYRREFAAIAEQSLQAGRNKIDPLFATVRTRIVPAEEWTHAGFSAAMFRNLNTHEEWKAAQPEPCPPT